VTVVTRSKTASAPQARTGGTTSGAFTSSTRRLEGSPDVDPVALFGAALSLGLEPFLWLQPDRSSAVVGIGAAWASSATGRGRFGAIAAAWESCLAASRIETVDGRGPILVGGLGFSGEVPRDPIWVAFGAASMVLPELILAKTPGGEWLTTSYDFGLGPDQASRLARLWQELLVGATSAISGGAEAPMPRLSVVASRPERAVWERLIDRLAGAVGRGRLDKVVLARRTDLVAKAPLDVVGALRRLAAGSPNSTTYAVARSQSVFLGATPERLVSTQGREFQTVAMAGSIRHSDDASEEAMLAHDLLGSDKDREEHAIVVETLRARLSPIVSELVVAPAPVVARFGPVQHLVTAISGRLRSPSGILALAALLHPTPAVGGEPLELALELIAEHESFERGWYAGPLGWVGADGDGDLVVALRCGVVSGPSAALFAGCGIVADSDPAREWDESRSKMQVVAAALGEVQE
jgi:isochorismate synthase